MKQLSLTKTVKRLGLASTTALLAAGAAQAVTFHTGSGSIDGSLCVGNDCISAEAFGFDTLRLKENNLRLHFDDTSTASGFPANDWRLYANDSASGGSSYFGVEDATAGRFVFRVFAGARPNALTIDSQGDLGLGTTTPATDIDIKTGDTPTVRLQQDGTSGFTPQTWDVAGNEAGFFIRDATSGSTLPFRIITGGAPSQSLVIDGDGDVGIGAGTNPTAPLEVERSDSFVFFRMTATGGTNPNDSVDVTYTSGAAGTGELRYNIVDGDNQEMSLDADGNLTIDGELTTSGSCSVGCDRVFTADYDLPSIEEHHAQMWEQGYLPNVGPTIEGQPFNVSDKLGRVLNELEHAHIFIGQQQNEIRELRAEMIALKTHLGMTDLQ